MTSSINTFLFSQPGESVDIDPAEKTSLTSHPELYVEQSPSFDKKIVKISGDQGAIHFAQAFAHDRIVQDLTISTPSSSEMRETTITLGSVGFTALGLMVRRSTSLKTLKITGYVMDLNAAMALMTSLSENTSLINLNLWKNRIEDHTAFEIVVKALNIPSLQRINLGENLLSEAGKQRIEDWVAYTKPLVKVQMF